jgi:hypothetical protein
MICSVESHVLFDKDQYRGFYQLGKIEQVRSSGNRVHVDKKSMLGGFLTNGRR